jgi:hypothetical protein
MPAAAPATHQRVTLVNNPPFFDKGFPAHEISTGKRLVGAFERDFVGYRVQPRHQPNDYRLLLR